MLTTLALAVPLFLGGSHCSDCTPDLKRPDLCRSHTKEESAGLRACRSLLKREEPERRRAGLIELALLTQAHSNAPSTALVKMLAKGLEDEDIGVRQLTAELLGDGQHPEAALIALVRAAEGWQAEQDEAFEQYMESADAVSEYYLERTGVSRGARKPRRKSKATLKREQREFEAAKARMDEIPDLLRQRVEYRHVLARQLSRFRDVRAEEALVVMLEPARFAGPDDPTVRAVARLGTRGATRALVQVFDAYETWLAEKRTEAAAPDASERSREKAREGLARLQQSRAVLCEALAGIAEANGLPSVQADEEDAAEAWRAWSSEHLESLPALGRMTMPWDE